MTWATLLASVYMLATADRQSTPAEEQPGPPPDGTAERNRDSWRDMMAEERGDNTSGADEDLEALSGWPKPSCRRFGCVAFKKHHGCQCDYSCESYGNCCHDYLAKCSRHGAGKIVATEAWVVMLAGQVHHSSLQRLLCLIVEDAQDGPICHNGLLFKGSVAGQHGYFFLENGKSGITNLLTGTKKMGVQITPAHPRFNNKPVLVRRVHGNLQRLSSVVEKLRNQKYVFSLPNIMRLWHRRNHYWSKYLMCSDFVAAVLVGIGCLSGDEGAYNALPLDFSSKYAKEGHALRYTCPVEKDTYWGR